MHQRLTRLLLLLAALAMISLSASADLIPVGFLSYDVTSGSTAQFDIANETGPNASTFPDTTFPITTSEHLTITSLTVDFSDGSKTVFGPSYFTLIGDGLSFDGKTIAIGGTTPQPIDATLVGTFNDHSITLNDGSSATIASPFAFLNAAGTGSPEVADTPKLVDGDFAVIYASTTSGGPPPPTVPEPGSFLLLATGLAGFAGIAYRKVKR